MRLIILLFLLIIPFIIITPNVPAFAMGGDSSEKSMGPDFNSGNKAIKESRFDDAIAAFKKSSTVNPDNADIENLIGYSYRQKKNYEKAFFHYNNALKIDSKHKGALEYMGIAYIETGNLSEAEELFATLKDLCAFCKERRSLGKAIKNYKRNN